jgi:hypothetical protein
VNPALRVAMSALIAVASATLLYPAYLSLRADGNKVFEPQAFDFALAAIAAIAVALGVQLVPWRAATGVGALGMLVGGGLLFGALAIFSIGVFILPVAVVLLVVLARVVDRAPLPVAPSAALGGAVIGYGFVVLFIALIIPPTFECTADGRGSFSSQRWERNEGTVTMSSSGSVGSGSSTGTIETSRSIATYRCEQAKVVEFRRESR